MWGIGGTMCLFLLLLILLIDLVVVSLIQEIGLWIFLAMFGSEILALCGIVKLLDLKKRKK